MARPKVLKEDTIRVGFHLERSINDFLNGYAESKEIKISEVLRDAATQYAQKLKEENQILEAKEEKSLKPTIDAYQSALEDITNLKAFSILNKYVHFHHLACDLQFPFNSNLKQLEERFRKYDSEAKKRFLALKLDVARQYLAYDAWAISWEEEIKKRREVEDTTIAAMKEPRTKI